jgi:ABC-type Fe3+/spermidine/putrescine transport system ATPase subunit
VRDASLDITRGASFALLEASGAGKTTLLRRIAGFEGATAGQMLIDGQEMRDTPPHRRPAPYERRGTGCRGRPG